MTEKEKHPVPSLLICCTSIWWNIWAAPHGFMHLAYRWNLIDTKISDLFQYNIDFLCVYWLRRKFDGFVQSARRILKTAVSTRQNWTDIISREGEKWEIIKEENYLKSKVKIQITLDWKINWKLQSFCSLKSLWIQCIIEMKEYIFP